MHDAGTFASERASQGGDEEMRRGADDRFTVPKGRDFIPGRLVMTAPASNLPARGPIRRTYGIG